MSVASPERAAPIFILAAPRSYAPLIGAMLGRNPAACGLPELNLFVADTLENAWLVMVRHPQVQVHGLLRSVAQLYGGEQSLAALAMARRWVMRRLQLPTALVFAELCARAAPFRIVEKSRAHLRDRDCLARIRAACPEAFYVHVVRHPCAQGIAVASEGGRVRSDPGELWADVEDRIAAFLETIPAARQVRIRAEEFLAHPMGALRALAQRLFLPADEAAVEAMLHPEDSPFAGPGPAGANLGDDPEFLRNPRVPASPAEEMSLKGPLPWRSDGAGFSARIVDRAHALGYA